MREASVQADIKNILFAQNDKTISDKEIQRL